MKGKKRDLWYAEMADAFYLGRSRKWIAKTTYTQVPLISDEGGKWKMDEKKVKFVIEADISYQNMRQNAKKNRRKKKIGRWWRRKNLVWSKKFCTSSDVKLQCKKNYISHFEVSIPKQFIQKNWEMRKIFQWPDIS